MEASLIFTILISFVISILPLLKISNAAHIYTITPTRSLVDDGNNETLVSAGQTSVLGFFSPGYSKKRYLGIWYKRKPETVVWVANRNSPLTDSNGEFTIKEGNLVLLNSTGMIVWSSNVSSNVANSPFALLLDSGNLILKEQESANHEFYMWQSFDYPTDSYLPGMKLGWDFNIGLERYITSWKSIDDPSTGDAICRISIRSGLCQFVTTVKSTITCQSGIWNGVRFSGYKEESLPGFLEAAYVFNEKEAYMTYESVVNSSLLVFKINPSGLGEHLILQNDSSQWSTLYTLPFDQTCDHYNYCGVNAVCMSSVYPVCQCLKGFTPRSPEEWREQTWSKGCVRETPLDCKKGEGFVKIAAVKLPNILDFSFNKNMSLQECEKACLKNCSCKAYSNSYVTKEGNGCLMWFVDLVDIRNMAGQGIEQNLFVRLSASDIKKFHGAHTREKLKIILWSSLTSGTFVFVFAFWCIASKLKKRKNCQEIAVKRLSKNSRQGLKEFKNEVHLIAKLQHRNLVALLGCCVQGEERMLIYEYMPKKSLDHFIFDGKRRTTLPWNKHFDIIRGVGRGLLYLHQDSKLQIVHRDLKASNILLDNNLNPKISDFGLARTFREDENEAKTKTVVGTYGYMPPEYTIEGKFSIKSDVFSFGVILLETVSGKKNRGFTHPDHDHNLLGHAWLLWNGNRPLDLMDVCFKDVCVESQVLKCIQVGLLCVQKFPYDRPTMSSVVFMLENDEAILPQPKQPGFFVERSTSDDQGSSLRITENSNSENVMTVSLPTGR